MTEWDITDVHVFVLGAPRSGTTWLQAMLGSHPALATPQETGVVHRFLAPWAEEFERKVDLAGQAGQEERVVGLPVVLTRERFDELLRHAVGVVCDAALEMKPGARIVVDKNPENSRHVPLIRRLVPDARFIHIIRDGRDVAASLVAAAETWGGRWAPSDIRRAAAVWREHVIGARGAAEAGEAYTEVRYGDLLRDGQQQLIRLFRHCGVDVDVDEASAIHAECEFGRMTSTPNRAYDAVLVGGEAARSADAVMQEPDGFFRTGKPGAWRAWGRRECWAFDDIAGDLLVELGYESGRDWCSPTSPRDRVARAAARRARTATVATRGVAGRVIRRAVAATAAT